MNEAAIMDTSVATDDSAWATVNTPLSVTDLMEFCQDIERLFRINPMLEFTLWEDLGDHRYHMVVKNISQEQPFELDVEMQVQRSDNEITIEYASGIKRRTIIQVEPSEFGSKLTLIDDYDGVGEEERNERIQEVDKSLVNWADYLQRFLIMWNKWSKHGWWRWYMKRVWQPMKPSGRRITYMFYWITLVEFALIALGAGIYWSEYSG